jgi:hypothetical protein
VTRRALVNVAFLGGLLIAGVLCGASLHRIGGLNRQQAQLEQCIIASRHSHLNEAARSTLTQLQVEVPICMDAAGYERALSNEICAPAMWQGDVFCYMPKSFLGKLVYRIETSSQRKRIGDESKTQSLRES